VTDRELAFLLAGLDRDQREAVLLRHVVGLSLEDASVVAQRGSTEVERLESQALAALTERLTG
jgi:DNA-directed RNA polymerase specialized sigma24 family protein